MAEKYVVPHDGRKILWNFEKQKILIKIIAPSKINRMKFRKIFPFYYFFVFSNESRGRLVRENVFFFLVICRVIGLYGSRE